MIALSSSSDEETRAMDDEYADDDDFEASVDATADVSAVAQSNDHTTAAAAAASDSDDNGADELRPPAAPEVVPRQRSQALQDALAVDDNALLGSNSDHSSDSDSPGSNARVTGAARIKRSATQRVSGRHLLDNSLWTFSIVATRIRSLQIPVTTRVTASMRASVPAIRELRVFAVLDKRAMQTQGSEWKREPRIETPKTQRSTRSRQSPASRMRTSPYAGASRYSGVLDEAKWRSDHGRLQWTLRMERFRRLKASSPRIKVLVFGIGENAVDASVHRLREDSASAHSESIVSCGWFFLDLRCAVLSRLGRRYCTRSYEEATVLKLTASMQLWCSLLMCR